MGLRAIVDDRIRWRVHVLEFAPWADLPLTAVTKTMAREWWAMLSMRRSSCKRHCRRTKRLAAQTLRNILNIVRRCFADAVEDGILAFNPFAGLRLHRSRSASTIETSTVLLPDEQMAGLGSLVLYPERWLVAFAMFSGVRQGEQWSLRLADVQPEGARYRVKLRFGSDEAIEQDEEDGPRKNGHVHVILLPPLASDALRRWLALLPSYAPHNPLGLVFPTRKGKRRCSGKSFRAWRFLEMAVGRHVRWHDLRHSFATSMAGGWWGPAWSLEELCVYLDHSSVKVTERYARLVKELAFKAVERMAPLRLSVHVPAFVRRPRARRRQQQRGKTVDKNNVDAATAVGENAENGAVAKWLGIGLQNRVAPPEGGDAAPQNKIDDGEPPPCPGCEELGKAYDALHDASDRALQDFAATRQRANENAQAHFGALRDCETLRTQLVAAQTRALEAQRAHGQTLRDHVADLAEWKEAALSAQLECERRDLVENPSLAPSLVYRARVLGVCDPREFDAEEKRRFLRYVNEGAKSNVDDSNGGVRRVQNEASGASGRGSVHCDGRAENRSSQGVEGGEGEASSVRASCAFVRGAGRVPGVREEADGVGDAGEVGATAAGLNVGDRVGVPVPAPVPYANYKALECERDMHKRRTQEQSDTIERMVGEQERLLAELSEERAVSSALRRECLQEKEKVDKLLVGLADAHRAQQPARALDELAELALLAYPAPWVADIDDPQSDRPCFTGKIYYGAHGRSWCVYDDGDSARSIASIRLIEAMRSELAARLGGSDGSVSNTRDASRPEVGSDATREGARAVAADAERGVPSDPLVARVLVRVQPSAVSVAKGDSDGVEGVGSAVASADLGASRACDDLPRGADPRVGERSGARARAAPGAQVGDTEARGARTLGAVALKFAVGDSVRVNARGRLGHGRCGRVVGSDATFGWSVEIDDGVVGYFTSSQLDIVATDASLPPSRFGVGDLVVLKKKDEDDPCFAPLGSVGVIANVLAGGECHVSPVHAPDGVSYPSIVVPPSKLGLLAKAGLHATATSPLERVHDECPQGSCLYDVPLCAAFVFATATSRGYVCKLCGVTSGTPSTTTCSHSVGLGLHVWENDCADAACPAGHFKHAAHRAFSPAPVGASTPAAPEEVKSKLFSDFTLQDWRDYHGELLAELPATGVPDEAFRATELGVREAPTRPELAADADDGEERASLHLHREELLTLARARTHERDAARGMLDAERREHRQTAAALLLAKAELRTATGLLNDVDRVGARIATHLDTAVKS